MRLWLKIVICIIIVELLGGAGGYFTLSSIKTWYVALEKPPGNPPNWIFGPVWTTLYALIGISLALVWHRAAPGQIKTSAIAWFVMQMVLNLAWTPIFFGAHQINAALIVIAGMWISIAVTIYYFRKADRVAALLLVPYLLWVSYATYLNAGYAVLNK